MIPDFLFDWIALNHIEAALYISVYCGILSAAGWIGLYLETRKQDRH